MSGTVAVEEGTREHRRVQREEPKPPDVVISGPSPEDVVAVATKRANDAERRAKRAQDQTREANAARAKAEGDAARAAAAANAGTVTTLQGLLDTAVATKESAKAALKAARESGDLDAEVKALDDFNRASNQAVQAETELNRIKATRPAQPPQPTQAQPGKPNYSPAAQKWIDEHPAFLSDKNYERHAKLFHAEAIDEGHQESSPSYFKYINEALADQFGENHGQEDGAVSDDDDAPPARQRQQTRGDRTSSGAPSGRGGEGAMSGWKVAHTDLGTIQYLRHGDGRMSVRVPDQAQMDNFKEGAKVCKMDLGEYIKEQVMIQEEEAVAPGSSGLKHGEGRKYR